MFEGFEGGGDRQSRRRFAVSSGASTAVCVLIIGVIVGLASRPRPKKAKPPPVKVVFHAPTKKPPPPPAPKPKPRPKRAAARTANKAAGPSAAPKQRPEGALPEADASAFQGGTFGGIAWGEEGTTGLGGGALGGERKTAPPPPPPSVRGIGARPVDEAERMTQPRPEPGNPPPAYPEEMRKKGIEALVILRVLIDEQGRVADIDVVQGQEPFLGAALAVVKTYRYQPARLDGRPTAVHRLIRVPFRLRS
jgi:periplasmic protein TonB